MSELSRRHPTPLSTTNNRYTNIEDSGRVFTEEEARALYQYKDFTGFLLAFKAVTERLRTAEDYELVTYRMMQKLHAQNVRACRGVHLRRRGAMARGRIRSAVRRRGARTPARRARLRHVALLDLRRRAPLRSGRSPASRGRSDSAQRSHNVVGIGIGGDERRAGPELFREVYEHAASNGLRLTVHAGETVGPESIWAALRELKPDRIGHGLHAIDDPELVRYLAEKQIPVEVCITSNVLTGCCRRWRNIPCASCSMPACWSC